ncbi:arylsulfatase [Sphingobacterium shayense]|uniref:sulfatase family protein n=1 Tax=Sphingobacterium shayense TaxID=626343 RepID=UPI00155444BF|nr:arylsulfatase [Sphingobacterium shayense]NQD69523.1 arylsulfatase [Sphingobacterium shayense]
MKHQFYFVAILHFIFVALFTELYAQPSQKRPNVVMIYVDDLGYGDLSCYGAKAISTPNIDKLAVNGIKFKRGYSTSATCTPSRFALMTGIYPWREKGHGILPGDAALIIPPDSISLPKIFKNAGYQTAVVGKWHLGLGDEIEKNWNKEIRPGPNEVGFDYSFIFPATADRVPTVFMENGRVLGLDKNDPLQVSYRKKVGLEPTGKENPELLKLRSSVGHNQTIVNGIGRIGYMAGGKLSRWTDEELGSAFLSKAQHFIMQNEKEPFFLFFAPHQIHVPRVPSTIFKGKSTLGYRGDAILELDWIVGELMKQLTELGLDKNTMIILSSDNGPVLDDGYADQAKELNGTHTPAGGLRGWKTDIYEGGTRVPFIITWPGKIDPGESEAMICQIDLIASFAALLGQKIPDGEAYDSKNILQALLGKSSNGRETLVLEGYGNLALIQNGWKYIPEFRQQEEQLFNLEKDFSESVNLAPSESPRVIQMSKLLESIKKR